MPFPPLGRGRAWAPRALATSMALAVILVAALAYWDEKRESADALEDFAEAQVSLAASVATDLATRLAEVRRDAVALAEDPARAPTSPHFAGVYLRATLQPAAAPPQNPPDERALLVSVPMPDGTRADLWVPTDALFSGAARLERSNAVALFFLPPQSRELFATDGRRIRSVELQSALEEGATSLRLAGAEAAHLSLPGRTALAGLARLNAGPLGRWGVAVVASAVRERDREARARWRLVLAVALAGGLVLAFGGLALRKQRKQLVLERELAVAAVERDRDERLDRVSKAATMMTLASGMAHELSTPLAAIVGRAEQLQSKTGGDERAQRSVQTILEQADRISQVIRGFLNLARGGSPQLQSADPRTVAAGALALVEHRFSKRGVMLAMSIPDGLPAIRCDVRLLEHALVNLLLNACDATPPGGHVLVGARSEPSGLSFTVTDNGTGISPEHAARITHPFFTTKAEGQGTGLGLAVTNEIVKSHRGTLSISPATPRGTCATLQIPFEFGEPDARA